MKCKRAYKSPLRQEQATDTRERILTAVSDLVAAGMVQDLSIANVAKRAKVTARTVYRYFPTRTDLIDAMQKWVLHRMGALKWPASTEELIAFPVPLFEGFDRNRSMVEAQLNGGALASLRRESKSRRVAALRKTLSDAISPLPEAKQKAALGVIKHLLSASAWKALNEDVGFDGTQAGQAVAWAIEVLIKDLKVCATPAHAAKLDSSLANLMGLSQAIVAAQDSNLLDMLASGESRGAMEWASVLGTDARATTLILNVLSACGIADKASGQYSGSARLCDFYRRLPGGASMARELGSGISSFLKSGNPLFRMDGSATDRERAYKSAVNELGFLFEESATRLAQMLPHSAKNILDVGCGSGVWSLAIGRHVGARVTGLDYPQVLERFRERAIALGLSESIDVIPGDLHKAKIDKCHYDMVLIANVLRLEPPDRAAAIVRRFTNAITPGGCLVVVDALAQGSAEKDIARALYGLNLGMRTKSGQVHEPSAIRRWMTDAGLKEISDIDLGVQIGAIAAVTGRRI